MMQPCFFHTSAEPLFGIYAPPAGPVARDEAVLLCPPIGHEYQRAHWALRQLAEQLTRAGLHVFRFDYTGQGDSWGRFETVSRSRWVTDVQMALMEMRDTSGVSRVSMVGLRLGAALAYETAAVTAVERLVLWDPVVQGMPYLAELRRLQGDRRRFALPVAPVTAWAGDEELVGYCYSAALVRELAAVDLLKLSRPRARGVCIVASANRPEYRLLHEQLPGSSLDVCPDAGDWDEVELHAETLLLGPLQRALLAPFKG